MYDCWASTQDRELKLYMIHTALKTVLAELSDTAIKAFVVLSIEKSGKCHPDIAFYCGGLLGSKNMSAMKHCQTKNFLCAMSFNVGGLYHATSYNFSYGEKYRRAIRQS